MNQSFYTAAVGAWQQQERLNVHGNNIANVNNYGFKAKKPSFAALMYDFIAGAQADELPRGTGTYMVGADTDFGSTGLADTGLDLDYAIEGHGFFALWDPTSGEYSYTRDGSFTMSEFYVDGEADPDTGEPTQEAKWYLSDGDGRFVMGRDGRLIELTEENMKGELPIGIFDFVNTNGMLNVGRNRFVPVEKNGQLQMGQGKLVKGYLERSNTDLAHEMVKVIESQRSFSYALKMIQTSDEIETTVNGLR